MACAWLRVLSVPLVGDAAMPGSDRGWRLHHAVVDQIVGRHSTSVLLRSDMGASRSKAVCHAALRQDHRLVAGHARVCRSPLEAGSTIRKPSPLLLAMP